MKVFTILTLPVLLLALGTSLLFSAIDPTPVSAACKSNFFGLPAWYDGLIDEAGGECTIASPGDDMAQWVWRIVLNIIEAMLVIVGYASAIMIIVGGYLYMVATGSPDKVKAAKDTIRNAAIGLLIALSSVAIINVITGAF